MNLADLLSDTTYRDRAAQAIDQFLAEHGAPVSRTQINGLRQIAIQQPLAVEPFADKQRQRAEKKLATASDRSRPKIESEIAFWKLIADLCEGDTGWSLRTEALRHLPSELREENIPEKAKGLSAEDRGLRKQLKQRQREWVMQWNQEHIPLFLRRLCTHLLYRLEPDPS